MPMYGYLVYWNESLSIWWLTAIQADKLHAEGVELWKVSHA